VFKAGEPVEWVYDGLAPALLPGALLARKGTPLIMALTCCLAGQRAGLHDTWLVCANDAQVPGTASGVLRHRGMSGAYRAPRLPVASERPLWSLWSQQRATSCEQSSSCHPGPAGPVVMQGLPPELAARQAGRTIAAPPAPNTWLAAVQAHPGASPAFIDATPRGGVVLDEAGVRAAYPQADLGAAGSGAAGGLSAGVDACGVGALAVWIDMVRTIVLAHQRRGESDDVAHWMYCLLGLDPHAPEWEHALPARPAG
jgi:hypothetical protein